VAKFQGMDDHNRKTKDLKTFHESVSWFKGIYSVEPHLIETGEWIRLCTDPSCNEGTAYRKAIMDFRKTGDASIKKSLPAVCPGAQLKSRAKDLNMEEKIVRLSGWMQFDIDKTDNPRMCDATKLRDELSKVVYVAFCSLSASGTGVWGLVKVSEPAHYLDHFNQLKSDFARLGIHLDPSKGGNPTDLRYYSFDPDAYMSKGFQIYSRYHKSSTPRQSFSRYTASGKSWDKASKAAEMISLKRIDLAPDYGTYRNIGFALAHEFGEAGRGLFHKVCQVSEKYCEKDADLQYTICLKSKRSGITIGTFFYHCTKAGITLNSH
jgi:hypothetical protein